jgi:hypothetical protein
VANLFALAAEPPLPSSFSVLFLVLAHLSVAVVSGGCRQ